LHQEQPSSPIFFDHMVALSPSHGGSNTGVDMDIELSDFDRDETQPDSYFHFGQELIRNSSPGDGARGRRVPDPPRVTRKYHPKLYGKSSLFNTSHIH
jgi:hypothetical protein